MSNADNEIIATISGIPIPPVVPPIPFMPSVSNEYDHPSDSPNLWMSMRLSLVCPSERQLSSEQEPSNKEENNPKRFSRTKINPPSEIIDNREKRFLLAGKSGMAR